MNHSYAKFLLCSLNLTTASSSDGSILFISSFFSSVDSLLLQPPIFVSWVLFISSCAVQSLV